MVHDTKSMGKPVAAIEDWQKRPHVRLDSEGKGYLYTPKEVEKQKDPEPVKEVKKYSEDELYAMNKTQQIEELKKYGITSIPKYEKDRVANILKAQGE